MKMFLLMILIERCANGDRRILNELNHRRYDCVHHTGTEHTLTERHTHVHTHTKNPSFFSFALSRLAPFALSFSLSSLLSFLVSFSFINERISLTPAFDVPLVAHLRSWQGVHVCIYVWGGREIARRAFMSSDFFVRIIHSCFHDSFTNVSMYLYWMDFGC